MDTNSDSSLRSTDTNHVSSDEETMDLPETTTEAVEPTETAAVPASTGAASDDDQVLVHPGLDWIQDPTGEKRVLARSVCHAVTWVIDLEDGFRLWRAFTTDDFFDLPKVPADLIGRFPDYQEAARQAERADFQVFRRLAANQNKFAELAGGTSFEEAAYGGEAVPFSLAASFLEGVSRDLKKNANGSWTLAFTIDQDIPQWLLSAKLGLAVKIGLVPQGPADDQDGIEARKRIDNVMNRARLRPVEPQFQEWMMSRYDRWGLIAKAINQNSSAVEEATAETIRLICGVPSRADFKINRDAILRFEALDREYYFDQAAAMRLWVPSANLRSHK